MGEHVEPYPGRMTPLTAELAARPATVYCADCPDDLGAMSFSTALRADMYCFQHHRVWGHEVEWITAS